MYLLPNIHAGKNTLQAIDYKIEGRYLQYCVMSSYRVL
ncbi:hypothetical protein APHACPA_1612 [Rickettsia amblyommatis str. Ac/Pa]|uniref:Uncharacterized protein n=2 Tax=Rickettsia TaxID=780 RepID=A0A0F3N4D3_RICAM|nr:hypothetical protein APHACPA_1612 [Rickettsia amblyommatis str. Ac/Pa]KJV89995.1 hypothetical protein RBEAN4_0991 [Rickettsia bellii str. RML An4]